MTRAYVSVGSNIEPETNVSAALRLLREDFGKLRCSQVYQCEAVGFDGPAFLNLVVVFDTGLPPRTVVDTLHRIEDRCGRKRDGARFASRTLDLDLVLYGDLRTRQDGLCLPREEVLQQAFVLRPLAEIAPTERHPGNGKTFATLWRDVSLRGSTPRAKMSVAEDGRLIGAGE
ncbi:MAG: 2-amino-4-hydroxy-6-hydroxymethyldihydropteridine diphosphokinase [Gammaproteobacteria bacterium]|nr:MAG: 2-amino-4-hydroxy-6-hydroxymethyldihydropteridine diphosphokinase [Gammaproteobacteria bacterium]